MTSKYLTFAQLLEAIIHESKNCGGKLFAPARKKNHDNRVLEAFCSLRLFFDNKDLQRYSDEENIFWTVFASEIARPMSMRAKLMLGNRRVAGIDPQKASVSYMYDRSTASKTPYHMNIVKYDENGAVLSNAHLEIPQIKEYLTNVYQLAEASAELWNIRYETEGLLL